MTRLSIKGGGNTLLTKNPPSLAALDGGSVTLIQKKSETKSW